MSNHTPEPWQQEVLLVVAPNGVPSTMYGGRVICHCGGNGKAEECEANSRRIVAAVNACKGLSDESLEAGVVAELLEACTAALDEIGCNDLHDLGFESEICGQLRSAIAKAKGEES